MEKINNSAIDSLRFVGDYGERKFDSQYRIFIPSNFLLRKQEIYLLKTFEIGDGGSKRTVIKCFPVEFLRSLEDGFLPKYGDQMVLCTVNANNRLTLGKKMDIDFSRKDSAHIVGRGHFFEIVFNYKKQKAIDSNKVDQMLSKITSGTGKKVRDTV